MRAKKYSSNNLPKAIPVGKANNLIGKTFGRLTVLYRCEVPQHIKNKSQTYWLCKCQCGNYISTRTGALITNGVQSCGCLQSEKAKQSISVINKSIPWNKQDLTNQKFGRLTALTSYSNNQRAYWYCKCDCGGTRIVDAYRLTKGIVTHCGCLNKSNGILKIENWLNKNNFNFINEFSFSDLIDKKPLRFDIAIIDDNKQVIFLIEYQGEQHFNKNNPWYDSNIVKHDKMKREYCTDKSIPLLIITYNDNIEQKMTDFTKLMR